MSVPCGCFVTTIVLCVTVTASHLLAPQNVELTSHNMNLRLSWRPPQNVTSGVLYSTQLWASQVSETRVACVNTTALHCELSDPSLGLHIMEFGKYNGSVRAHYGVEMSEWVNSKTIEMDRDTVIGPPGVFLVSNGVILEVVITDPKFHISTVAHVFSLPHYNISYWPRGHQHRVRHVLVEQNRAALEDLEAWSEYCVQVRVVVSPGRNRNPSESSEPVCASTKEKRSPPWLAACLTFVALVLAVVPVVIAVFYHKWISNFLCPKDALPQPLMEVPRTLSYLKPPYELYHPLSVVPGHCIDECKVSEITPDNRGATIHTTPPTSQRGL